MDNFLQQYIISALWSSTDDEGEPLGDNYSIEDIAPETLDTMRTDCDLFKAKASGLYSIAEETRAAHDFWLTRNGHGAGFWDGDWKEPEASQLTAICKEFGEVNLYIGDDGKIYNA